MHTRIHGAFGIEFGVITDMQHMLRRHANRLGRRAEEARIGLGHAGAGGAQGGLEVPAYANDLHVGIAVGQRHHRPAPGQELQRRQGIELPEKR